MASSQADTLQKLERLTQLETMVAEQRIRIEKYRTMYETIKTELVQVEDVSAGFLWFFDIRKTAFVKSK